MCRALLFAAALVSVGNATWAAEPSFRALEHFSEDPGFDWPVASSANGNVLLGYTSGVPWTWKRETGYTPIVSVSETNTHVYFAHDISPDGRTTFGSLSVDMQGGAYFRL